jgi:hypothetical protein
MSFNYKDEYWGRVSTSVSVVLSTYSGHTLSSGASGVMGMQGTGKREQWF